MTLTTLSLRQNIVRTWIAMKHDKTYV